MVRRIAVSTGGGDCPGLNAVIRAVVTTAIGDYGIEVFGIETGFDGLMGRGGARVRPLTLDVVRGILPEGGTILGTSNRGSPFAMPREGGGTVDRSQEIVDRLDELGIDTVVSIGDDDNRRLPARPGAFDQCLDNRLSPIRNLWQKDDVCTPGNPGVIVVADRSRTAWFGVLPSRRAVAIAQD